MLTRGEFREEYPSDSLEEHLLNRPIAGVRDIQYLYGVLYTLGTAGGSDYAAYLTPDAARGALDSDDGENVIAAQVDLSGDVPRLDPDQPVYVTSYTDGLVEPLAHCYFKNRGSGIDHSLTQLSSKSGNDPEKLGKYVYDRLSRWPTEDAVEEVAASHPDGEFISDLAELAEREGIKERLIEAVTDRIGGKRTAMLSARIKTAPEDEYRWPGEFEVFNEGMKAQKTRKLESKGLSGSNTSSGEAVDLVTGESGRTVGTASDPLNYYLTKQPEKFPNVRREDAWRTHPVSEDVAVRLGNAESFLDACTYNTFGATVYVLPYFNRRLTPSDAYQLYGILREAVDRAATDDRSFDPIEMVYEQLDFQSSGDSPLRFYVAVVSKPNASRWDVFGDTMSATPLAPIEIRENHQEILDSWVYDSQDRLGRSHAPLPTAPNWPLLEGISAGTVTSGSYLRSTFPRNDEGDDEATPDDDRIEVLLELFSGRPVHVDILLRQYVKRILSTDDAVPELVVASQYAQLCALAKSELIETTGSATANAHRIASYPTYGERFMDTSKTDIHPVEEQHEKITRLIDETPAFDDDQRRGAFLLGALVGAVGNRQAWKYDRSTTLVDQYPVGSITPARIRKVAHETIDKVLTYSRQEGRSETLFEWLVDPLRETLLEADTDEFTLSKDDLRYHYALGVTYGMNDRMPSTDDESTDDQPSETTEASQ